MAAYPYFSVPTPNLAQNWNISVGAFFDRFGEHMIPILADPDAVVQALIKNAQVRSYIDLKNPSIPQMLDILISKGHDIDKTAILETYPLESERP